MKNYAGTNDKDDEIAAELEAAGIEVHRAEWMRNEKSEVSTSVMGFVHGWTFKRVWRYWTAEGPGIPPDDAMRLHETHGTVVRVAGHCGCPSPLEWNKGFGTGSYHVDTAEGLKALADTIKAIHARATAPPQADSNPPGLPPGILQAYRDGYVKAYKRNHLDAHVAGVRAALALAELLADPSNLPPYDERPRTPIGPDYHAQPGETKGHLHDVFTTRGELHGYDRIYVGSLMRSAVEDLAAACAETVTQVDLFDARDEAFASGYNHCLDVYGLVPKEGAPDTPKPREVTAVFKGASTMSEIIKIDPPMKAGERIIVTSVFEPEASRGEGAETRYQYREIGEGDGWRDCSKSSYDSFQSDPHIDTREIATPTPAIKVDVQRMNTSRGADFYVRISCGGRETTPFMFRERFKAEYEAAHFAWIFGLRPDAPEILAYDETTHPNDPPEAS